MTNDPRALEAIKKNVEKLRVVDRADIRPQDGRYALADLASVGLLVSTIATLSPERRPDVAGLGMKSWLAGNMASMVTGALIGLVTWN